MGKEYVGLLAAGIHKTNACMLVARTCLSPVHGSKFDSDRRKRLATRALLRLGKLLRICLTVYAGLKFACQGLQVIDYKYPPFDF